MCINTQQKTVHNKFTIYSCLSSVSAKNYSDQLFQKMFNPFNSQLLETGVGTNGIGARNRKTAKIKFNTSL